MGFKANQGPQGSLSSDLHLLRGIRYILNTRPDEIRCLARSNRSSLLGGVRVAPNGGLVRGIILSSMAGMGFIGA